MTAVAETMEAKVASLESQLATVKAQADADQLNAEHLMEQMEQRYAALAAEHTQVSGRRTTCAKRASAIDAIARDVGRAKEGRACY